MRRTFRFQPFVLMTLGISATAFFIAVTVPHYHDAAAASDPDSDQSCRACQTYDGLAAYPPGIVMPVVRTLSFVMVLSAVEPSLWPRQSSLVRAVAPRSPPSIA